MAKLQENERCLLRSTTVGLCICLRERCGDAEVGESFQASLSEHTNPSGALALQLMGFENGNFHSRKLGHRGVAQSRGSP